MVQLFDIQLTPHFRLREFSCKCGGKYPDCDRTLLHAGLAPSLEVIRTQFYETGLSVISGYRCRQYNQQVGGAETSQHLFGTAADIQGRANFTAIHRLRLFSGIGINRATSRVVHVDVRHLGPENSLGTDRKTKASPANPAVWFYG